MCVCCTSTCKYFCGGVYSRLIAYSNISPPPPPPPPPHFRLDVVYEMGGGGGGGGDCSICILRSRKTIRRDSKICMQQLQTIMNISVASKSENLTLRMAKCILICNTFTEIMIIKALGKHIRQKPTKTSPCRNHKHPTNTLVALSLVSAPDSN